MANEAVKRYSESSAGDVTQDYTVVDGTGIEKGTLLKLTDARTASKADGGAQVLAGIAARDKVADDGRTQLSVYRKGDFDMTASGAITIGAPVVSSCTSTSGSVVDQAWNVVSGAQVLGYALEATAAGGETLQVYVNVGGSGAIA